MKSLVVSTLLLANALALPTSDVPSWTPPGPNDIRGPCPLLNTLANHNIIPHNGKNITLPILVAGFNKYINVGSDVAIGAGSAALTLSPIPNSLSFDLSDIDKHDAIEHDGSLSRLDAFQGNDHSFNPYIYAQTQSYFTQTTIDIPTAAKARAARINNAKMMNPTFALSTSGTSGSLGETSFYLSVFGDPVTGVAQKNWVNVFFQEERLPYAEGWTRRTAETNFTSLGAMSQKIVAATPNFSLPPGFNFNSFMH
ncbi:putative sterigmatocystin biosynthesis peroxidase [Lachnellula suecica]|uniref:Putative sterigmatocystin biosynthesis peroxidase n=1 Tax=Lachnellula suecica TaxID=602035 RepID=A0A8T9BZ50_9HELO|nr:putative sterigmatocystin biosynthesis peroxidase [Lachnellula suecica]